MSQQRENPEREETQDNTASNSEGEAQPTEVGGRKGPEPTRYGDWEKNGRCIDF